MSGFFVDVDMMEVCLCTFCLHLDDVVIPWESTSRFRGSKFYCILIRVFRAGVLNRGKFCP